MLGTVQVRPNSERLFVDAFRSPGDPITRSTTTWVASPSTARHSLPPAAAGDGPVRGESGLRGDTHLHFRCNCRVSSDQRSDQLHGDLAEPAHEFHASATRLRAGGVAGRRSERVFSFDAEPLTQLVSKLPLGRPRFRRE